MKPLLLKTFMYAAIPALLVCCSTKEEMPVSKDEPEVSLETKALYPEEFHWDEQEDFMPTPRNQEILVPWAPGNGGLDAFYGPDILYDYLSYDGWEMVYSTFKSSGPKLIDPYFVLYNKYRGTLRVYVYINSLTYTPSTYLQYSLMINGSDNTSILNFLGNEIIDQSKNPKSYNAVMQEPLNGGAPAMNNQRYMMEFELAYDPSLKDKSAQSLRFGLKTDCYNVSTIKLGGTAESEISGNIGATSSTPMDLIKKQGSEAVKGVFGIVGESALKKLKREPTSDNSHNNKLGLKNEHFTKLLDGASKMVSSFIGGIPSVAGTILSAIIGGKTSTPGQAVSLKGETTIELTGTISNSGAINSISMYIPGMNFGNSSSMVGYIPAYNKPLGLVNFVGDNTLHMRHQRYFNEDYIENAGVKRYYTECFIDRTIDFDLDKFNYVDRLIFNPEVEKIANISVIEEDLIARIPGSNHFSVNVLTYESYRNDMPFYNTYIPFQDLEYGVRFLIKVQPKNGAPASYVYKTFRLKERLWDIDRWHDGWY